MQVSKSCINFKIFYKCQIGSAELKCSTFNAADDPFFSTTFFPWQKDCDKGGVAPLKLVRTTNGGHLGHLFQRFSDDEKKDMSSGHLPTPVSSFALSELGRFINHVHTNIKT